MARRSVDILMKKLNAELAERLQAAAGKLTNVNVKPIHFALIVVESFEVPVGLGSHLIAEYTAEHFSHVATNAQSPRTLKLLAEVLAASVKSKMAG